MQQGKNKFSVRDNVSGEFVTSYGPNFINMGDEADRIIFESEEDAMSISNALDQFDDTLPEIIKES